MKNDYISQIHKKDKFLIHPYEDFETKGSYDRKLILKSNNIYLYDENGKEYIDGPGGMWNNNIGHGNTEIAEAVKNQIFKMDYLKMVRRIGVEPITSGAEIRRSIQLKLPAQ